MDLEKAPFWKDAPVLSEELDGMYKAFWELSPSRPVTTGGVGSIPFEAADRYAERFGISDFEEFWTLLRAMDAAFQKHYNERRSTA